MNRKTQVLIATEAVKDFFALDDNEQAEILNSMGEHYKMLLDKHGWEVEMQVARFCKKLTPTAKAFLADVAGMIKAGDEK